MGNEARMANDYRGTPPPASARPTLDKKGRKVAPKAKPNAFFHSMRTTTLEPAGRVLDPERSTPAERLQAGAGELRMGIFVGADEGIEKGQEILISCDLISWRWGVGLELLTRSVLDDSSAGTAKRSGGREREKGPRCEPG